MQDEVLSAHPSLALALVYDLDGRGNAHPDAPGGHRHGNIRGAHTRGKCANRPVCAGVGICAHDDLAGKHQPLLRQQGVLNPHTSHFPVVHDAVLARKLAHLLALLG